ncbi:hypothetical protein [Peribacillus sp. TH24]|uniref:hypothetical protein n=1 Tax=Peribacillus sp. TH24 TaxID=2798483 RepID=UPI00191148D8|nr:hypothetical protein [Peribacillus sp. TH24]MBK5446842.1 hypothetical protein [Peribacillus sp. TH24]
MINLLYLLPILGAANVYFGWTRKYKGALSWVTAIVVFLLLWTIVGFNHKSDNLSASNGFFMAAVGMIAAIASIVIVRKERSASASETNALNK